MKIKAALIVDRMELAAWQIDALNHAADCLEIDLILNCTDSISSKKYSKNVFYYLLNLLSLRNYLTKKSKVPFDCLTVNFKAELNDGWQHIPNDVLNKVLERDLKVIIKFGMNLLYIAESYNLDILSFHHGDPENYRGRPAGFYELYSNDERVGVVVQRLTNMLDAGVIYAKGFSKIEHYSYKKTSINFYKISKFLLRLAIINYVKNDAAAIKKIGTLYKLPSNRTVLLFVIKLLYRKVRRLLYGVFFEKKWDTNLFPLKKIDNLSGCIKLRINEAILNNFNPKKFFFADPFFCGSENKFFVEVLNSVSGLGEIFEVNYSNDFQSRRILGGGGHYSYPFTFNDKGDQYMMPEVASHSSPFLLTNPFEESKRKYLLGLENLRLLDATLFLKDNVYYLFGSQRENSADCLNLFFSDNLLGPYVNHPLNPVVIDPKCSRMGGRLIQSKGKLYRFGQNNCYEYGNGLSINEVKILTKNTYYEEFVGSINFEDVCGPHNIDVSDKSVVIDFYENNFSLFAGYRRLIALSVSIIRVKWSSKNKNKEKISFL